MRGKHIFLFLIIVLVFSGCTQSGMIVNKSIRQDNNENEIFVEYAEPDYNNTQTYYETDDPCNNIKCPDSVTICPDDFKPRCRNNCTNGICTICMPSCYGHGTCEGVSCKDSSKTCPDGYEASCRNTCHMGFCTKCAPDCSDHDVKEEECDLICGDCHDKNPENCLCDLIVPCDGNGMCEEGEYPGSTDCPECSDNDECTEDLYDYETGQCYRNIFVPCCGNGMCEDSEDNESCLHDCEHIETEEPEIPETTEYSISINALDPVEEWVRIVNLGTIETELTGWKLNDTLSSPKVIFTFPEFVLQPGAEVYVLQGSGDGNSTHIYRNKNNNVWNNDKDTAVLIDDKNNIISTYSY